MSQEHHLTMATPEENKAAVREFFAEIWNNRSEAAIDRFVPENAAGNDPDFGTGREAFRAQWKQWMAAFPDLHFELIDMIAEGDQVLTRWELTGTHSDAPFMGVEPTGTEIRVQGMSFDRMENGQCIEGFDGWDGIGLRRQLGLYDGA